MAQYEVTFAGFGGQGIMTAGQLLAYAGISEGKQVAWIPSYGPEMRGGTAYCTVVISDKRIGSPIVTSPQCICVFNRPSFDKFGPMVKPGGLFLVNSSLIDVTSDRTDFTQVLIPANDMAIAAGNVKVANVIVLGALIGISKVVDIKTITKTLKEKLSKKKEVLELNFKMFKEGYKLGREKIGQKDSV
ncbi:MAG: 2-oxoacid:ferredoxin oxidoreductase subunit gamma [Candidatus Zixiibacteriota bacterium]|nr:MAG: 2-oxoacid:ferredoxin oxidoreductase subunit gamma [candidate division Zixibacteria bacterium]